jgi:dTDP-4-amino-4,6-dideoxygalactose transaminase
MPEKLAIHGGPKTRDRPFPSWPVFGPEEEDALRQVLHGGKWGLGGEQVPAFERAFAEYQGCRHGVAVCNGTIALHVAVLAAGVQAGDEVIVPPYTFLATASAVVAANAVPVFVDIDPETCCIDPDGIEAAITPRTRAMDRILAVARRHGLVVIEDAAQAHGAEYQHRRVGSLGDMGCFSFQSSKNLTAGEGGMVVANDDSYAERCRSIHNCGRTDRGGWYDHHVYGANFRMTAFQAAILLRQMKRLDEQTDRRNRSAERLNATLAEIPGIDPLARGRGETRHGCHLYVYRYDAEAFGGVPRERFLEAARAEGVPTVAGYGVPLYEQPWFRELRFGPYTGYRHTRPELDYRSVDCPACREACRTCCWLPQSVLLGTPADMDGIVRAFRKVYDAREELKA